MNGKRLPDGEVNPWPPANGAYWRGPLRFGEPELAWYCVTPNGLYGSLAGHAVTEHEDGTITVSPSILVTRPHKAPPSWHGFLERGEWREV